MRPKDPPAIMTWMLEHLTFDKNEALAGDLLEEFRRGRSRLWYCRQALVAIVLGFASGLRTRWPAVGYATLWAVPVPAISLLVIRRIEQMPFFAHRWQLDWPYSTICDIALFYGCNLIYLSLGLVLYFLLFSLAMRGLNPSRLARSLWISAFVFVAVSIGLNALFTLFSSHAGYMIDVRHTTAVRLIAGSFFLEFRLPFFLALLISIWKTLPRMDNRTARVAL